MANAANQAQFADRVQRISARNAKTAQKNRAPRPRNLSGFLVVPLMLFFVTAGAAVFAWDAMDRPGDTPLESASIVTAAVLSF